jgi:hypothetical protein
MAVMINWVKQMPGQETEKRKPAINPVFWETPKR